MRGYELAKNTEIAIFLLKLRIPMRGYESVKTAQVKTALLVTNPHEGL